ncbi:MAG: hypothetical protein RJA92_213 [Bacteroidota bacterium]|jgi:hypothetical protein
MLKKFIQTALLLVVLFSTVQSYAQVSQAPDGIQFQALATDANGHPAAGRVIYVKDAIIAKTATGSIVYSETFKVTASSAGIFTIVLGKGTYASGVSSIANIDWANGPFFLNLKVAVEPTVPNAGWNANNEYVDLGTSQFWSVPYALYAGNVKGADTKLNISDTAAMLKPYFTAINLKANIESPTFTGTVKGITKAMVGLANVDNTSDIDKPVSTATKTALDLKANAADVATALALKANAADVTTALALKANATDVTTALDLKVDKVSGKALSTNDYTTAEKTKLAAITGTNTGDQDLSALAVAADVNAALALKANTADVTAALDTKVSSADATVALALKANTADVNAALALKANGANVANSLALKANTADVNTALALKANITDVNAALALKANTASLSTVATSGSYNDLSNKPTIPFAYTLPTASASVLGGVKVGANLSIDANGVLSATASNNASSITGTLPVANGGTGTTTIAGIKSILGLNTTNVAIGDQSGQTSQAAGGVGVGAGAGANNQGGSAVAIGYVAGYNNQGASSIAIGPNAAQGGQGAQSVAIGFAAGQNGQGANAVAIGTFAGQSGQAANSIAINASGTSAPLNPANAGFYVDPIRNASSSNSLFYNSNTKEITYGTAPPTGAINLASGVTGTLPIANGGTGATTAAAALTNLGAAPVASPTFTGTVTTDIINTGALSATSVTAPTYASAPKTLTYTGSTINWNPAQGLNAAVTLTQNSTLSFTTAPPVGSYGTVVLTQDATGNRTITLPTINGVANKVLGSASTSSVALSTAANAKDILNFYFDGSSCYWNIGQGYGTAATPVSSTTNLASSVSGTLPIANGGTGQTTLSGVKNTLGLLSSKVAIGADAGLTSQGNDAIAIGYNAGLNNQGASSIAIGYLAGGTATQGSSSIAIGPISGGGGNNSVAIGLAAWTGANNATAVGTLAAAGHVNSAALGYQAVTTSPNTIQLGADGVTVQGSTAITNVRTSGSLTAGAVTYPNTNGTAGQVLTANNNGNASWTTIASVADASTMTGTVAIAKGGTGATTATAALTNLGAAPIASPTFTGTVTTGAINAGAITATSVTAPIYASTPQVLTDGSTITWNPALGLNASVTLGGNRTLSFSTTPVAGAYGTLVVSQDGTGNRTITLPSTANKVLGSTSTTTIALSTAANAKDILNFYYDGTNCFWNIGQGYGTAAASTATNLATGVTGTLTVANGGTGATTLTGLIKGNGTSAMTAATAGTDYQAPIVLTTTGTGAATLSGTTLNIPSVSTVRLNSDEFDATAGQTSFTLSQTALNSKVFMFINGTRIKNGAFSVSGTTVTYTAANNNSYALVAGDRIQFDYAY